MAVNGFGGSKGGAVEKGGEGEGVGLDTVGKHLGVVRKCLVVEL